MRAVPLNNDASTTYSARSDGILQLPLRLRRDLILLFVVKLVMLGLLYLLFFSPMHRPAIDTMAHIAGQQMP